MRNIRTAKLLLKLMTEVHSEANYSSLLASIDKLDVSLKDRVKLLRWAENKYKRVAMNVRPNEKEIDLELLRSEIKRYANFKELKLLNDFDNSL